jgi:hypothetical protein
MLDKIDKGIAKTTAFLEKVNHVLNYVVVIAWLIAGLLFIVKMVSKLWN